MKLFEIIFLFLTTCFVILSKWYSELSYILIVFTFLVFFAKLIREYLKRRKETKLFIKLFNIYYRSIFFVGLIFILYNYPGKDILSLSMVLLTLGYIIFHALTDQPNRMEQFSAYIYMKIYILFYFCIPWFIQP